MIGHLRGRLLHKQPPDIVIDVGGVGYELQAPTSTFYELPDTGAELSLHTHLVVREDAQELYGFASLAERHLFRSLIRVSGVGARLALAVLSGMSVEDFAGCVQRGDVATLVKLPGVGKKTAERLLVDMRDRVAAIPVAASSVTSVSGTRVAHSEAYSALVALGYRTVEVAHMLKKIDTDGLSTEEIIRLALQDSASEA